MRRWVVIAMVLSAATARAGSLSKQLVDRVTEACVLVQAVQGRQAQSGSGFFVSRNEVVTNYHVIQSAIDGDAELVIVVNSGKPSRKVVEATIVGADEELDLALLRTAYKAATSLRFLRESQLRVTEAVWVAGYPFGTQPGLEVTVTAGTVSSLRRDDEGGLHQVQIDAAINPGNSGGPVVDGQGRVVGVTRAVVTPAVGAGMAIAIPCGAVESFVKEAQKARHRTAALRLKGRTSRQEYRVTKAEKVEEPWGTSVRLTVRGGRDAGDAKPFTVEITDRRRKVLKRQSVLLEELSPREEISVSIRVGKTPFNDVSACEIVE